MSEPELLDDFFGVYLLYNINPKFKGRTYIGYTRDPNRRIMQHNRGTWAGGAYRTSNRGPWKMALIVHGFPNNISALRFEWAWQNPTKTIRLQHLNLKKIPRKETEFQFKLRVMLEMLKVGPWCRLPLSVRWLEEEYFEEFPLDRTPPIHMPIVHGPVKVKNFKTNLNNIPNSEYTKCSLCLKEVEYCNSTLKCLNQDCELISHITCLAQLFLSPGEYVPIDGNCPFCNIKLEWGDLIRSMRRSKNIQGEEIDDDCATQDIKDCQNEDEESVNQEVLNNSEQDPNVNSKSTDSKTENDLPYWFDDCNYNL